MRHNELYVDSKGVLRTKNNNIVIGELAIGPNNKFALVIKKSRSYALDIIPLSEFVKTLYEIIEDNNPTIEMIKEKLKGSSSKNPRENTK